MIRRMDYVHINGEGELIERPNGMLVDYASYAILESACREEHGGKNHEPECPICVALDGSTPSGGDKP